MSRQSPSISEFSSGILRIKVKDAVFVVHEPLILACSTHFERLCAERLNDGCTDEPIELEGTEPDLFHEVVLWVYGLRGFQQVDSDPKNEGFLVALWLLAERLEIPNLQNYVLSTLGHWLGGENPDPASVYLIYEETPNNSPLRLYTAYTWARWASKSTLMSYRDGLPWEFMADLSIFLFGKRDDKRMPFHEHEDSLEQYYVQQKPKIPKPNARLQSERSSDAETGTRTPSQIKSEDGVDVNKQNKNSAAGKRRKI